MSDFAYYKMLENARVSSSADISNAAAVVSQSHTREMAIPGVANVNANSAEGVSGSKRVPYASQLRSAFITLSASSVANTTDYSVVNVFKHTGNGAAVLMGTANLANLAVTAAVPIAVTLVSNTANTTLLQGDVVTSNNVKTGNGVANNGVLNIELTVEDV